MLLLFFLFNILNQDESSESHCGSGQAVESTCSEPMVNTFPASATAESCEVSLLQSRTEDMLRTCCTLWYTLLCLTGNGRRYAHCYVCLYSASEERGVAWWIGSGDLQLPCGEEDEASTARRWREGKKSSRNCVSLIASCYEDVVLVLDNITKIEQCNN